MNWKDAAEELEFESKEELKAVACGCSCAGRAEEQRDRFCLRPELCCPKAFWLRSAGSSGASLS